jgi:hypothetical protein
MPRLSLTLDMLAYAWYCALMSQTKGRTGRQQTTSLLGLSVHAQPQSGTCVAMCLRRARPGHVKG